MEADEMDRLEDQPEPEDAAESELQQSGTPQSEMEQAEVEKQAGGNPAEPAEPAEPAAQALAESAEPPVVAGYDQSSPKKWFIIHTYSGFEHKVQDSLRTRADAF